MITMAKTSAQPKTRRRGGLRLGMVLNSINIVLNFSASFIVTPIIIKRLGAPGFGMWALIQSFSGYYGLVNLGVGSALQRFLSRDLAAKNQGSLQQTLSTAIAFFSATSVLVITAAATLGSFAAQFFDITDDHRSAFTKTLLLCAVAVVADFFGAITTTLLTSRERFDLSNTITIARQLAQTTGILLVLSYWPSLDGIALVVSSVGLASLIVGNLYVRRLYPELLFTWAAFDLKRLKEMLHYGSSTILLTISNIVRLRLGNLVIAKTAGLTAVGMFSIASNLVLNMNSLLSGALNVLNPRFTRLHTEGKWAELQHLYRTALMGSAAVSCGMGMMLLLFGERFIMMWVGKTYVTAVPILNVLTVAYVLALAQAPSWNLMFAVARHHFMARVTIAEAAAITVLGIWLSRTHGAVGFAWATGAAMLVTKGLIHAPYAARIGQLKLREYLEPMAAPFACSAGMYAIARAFGLLHFLRESTVIVFLGVAAAFAVMYAALVLVLTHGRSYAPNLLGRFLPRPAVSSA